MLDGNQSNHFTYLGQSERDFCAGNNCFLTPMQVLKLLTNSLKDTLANSEVSGVMLCLQQTAAWTSAMPRPSLIIHPEVILLHVYITAKTGNGGGGGGGLQFVFLLKYPETCESVSASASFFQSVKQLSSSASARYSTTPSVAKLTE